MKILFLGSIRFEYDCYKYKNFNDYIEFKKSFDKIFEINDIPLVKIPRDPTEKFNFVYYEFIFEYKSEIYYKFMDIIDTLGFKDKVVYRLDFKFTKDEMEKSPLFSMATYYDFYATNIKFPSFFGTKYEKIFVCPKCGSVKYKQVSDLYWNTTQMKKKLFLEIPNDKYNGEYTIIITETLANIFKEHNFTGYTLKPVIHVGNKNKEKKCFQMIINNIMPPFSKEMPYLSDMKYCKECSNGVIIFPPYYETESLNDFKDFNLSFEENVCEMSRQPLLLVSQKVKRLFDILKIKPVYQPIIVVKNKNL